VAVFLLVPHSTQKLQASYCEITIETLLQPEYPLMWPSLGILMSNSHFHYQSYS